MAREPSLFVRDISPEEGQKLTRITRRSNDPIRLRRAAVVLASAQGRPVRDICMLFQCSESYVRDVVHAFNDKGFAALDPKWSGGRPRVIDDGTIEEICRIALTAPAQLGRPFTVWSLSKLREYLIDTKVVTAISIEWLRKILHGRDISWQATTTWKASKDPQFLAKMDRILGFYDHRPPDGRVLCFDEFGPLNLQPRPGRGWFPAKEPLRLRATYTRPHGVRHMLAALDLDTGRLTYRIRTRKRWQEFLSFLKTLRLRYPDRLYIVLDNFSPHLKGEVADWCRDHDVELVFTPTNASWLNWIESEFAALRHFTLNGSDYRSHREQGEAIARYVRWRNSHAEPKRDFAITSKIRRPEWQHQYLANVS